MSGRVLLALIFCNVVWSAHPAMGKLVLVGFPASQGAWLRYASALISYTVAMRVLKSLPGLGSRVPRPFMLPSGPARARDWGYLLLLGFSAFCFSPLLQMTGLDASRAVDNSLIIAMEPLMTVFLAWLVLGEKLSRATAAAFGVALVGFALLTGLTPSVLSRGWDSHLTGNLILLISLLGEAIYSMAGRKLIDRYAPSAVFGSALAVGVFFLSISTALISGLPSPDAILHMPWQSLVGMLWLGPLGTGVSYLIWMMALAHAPVASLALTLFIQPMLGPAWGALFLGERLTLLQGVGCALILGAVFGQAWLEARARRVA